MLEGTCKNLHRCQKRGQATFFWFLEDALLKDDYEQLD